MTRRQLAEKYFCEGYSCAQAVALAFEDKFAMDREELLKIASSFGGGLGRLREVCGAVSGMCMVAGVLHGYSSPKAREAKAEHYALIQQLAGKFKEKNGSIVCRELLGAKLAVTAPTPEERTAEYYKIRPCARFAGDCAEILSQHFGIE